MNVKEILSRSKSNRMIEIGLANFSVLAANTWVTLIAPIIVGIAIARLLPDPKITISEALTYLSAILVHIVCMRILFTSATRHSLSLDIEEVIDSHTKLKDEDLPEAINIAFLRKLQLMTAYLATLELEQCIDEMNQQSPLHSRNVATLMHKHFDRILKPLVDNRESLFGYQNGSLYNMAIYLHIQKDNLLKIAWRNCDSRIQRSERTWEPGFGHVGLTYIHNEMKICPDIQASSELGNSSTPSDSKQYRSFLSVPINDCSSQIEEDSAPRKKPHGVLVLTSAHSGQFSLERDQVLLLTIAKLLSIYIDKYSNVHLVGTEQGGPQ